MSERYNGDHRGIGDLNLGTHIYNSRFTSEMSWDFCKVAMVIFSETSKFVCRNRIIAMYNLITGCINNRWLSNRVHLSIDEERTGETMSDNRQIFRTIRTAIRQLYSGEPKGNLARNRNTVACLIASPVGASDPAGKPGLCDFGSRRSTSRPVRASAYGEAPGATLSSLGITASESHREDRTA
jgi:hypothetical protein